MQTKRSGLARVTLLIAWTVGIMLSMERIQLVLRFLLCRYVRLWSRFHFASLILKYNHKASATPARHQSWKSFPVYP
uniref:Uncharacterized protein n=1 Tax=Picea glauca TaxID=3330 RepID=A0A117NGM1_PICGL|nr:hypothetical protein ABT39_MTgene6019 [Picea glauca]QHR86828.1 hypothetical protein Q903MT_gene835 [Picea sitchensis]